MDHSLMPRSVWSGDSKVLQHPADLFTSVVVTRSIPAGTSFGPCVLQNTFYDTIAFIALKSSDKTNKSYVFRVDPEAMRNSSLVLSWLRLVAAARNPGEQNTEAFLKAGQLYVRTVRDVQPEEELLVWYDQELSHLLGFTDMRRGASQELKCGRCGQVFKNEFPFLSHCRFLCAQVKSDNWSQRDIYEQNKLAAAEIRRPRRVTDFHNIARDLEHKKSPSNTSGTSADAVIYPKRRKYEDTPCAKGRKTVLLEKTNISNDDNISTQLNKGPGYELLQETGNASSSSVGKLKADKSSSKPDHLGCTKNFAEETFTHERKMEARSEEEEEAAESSSTSSGRRSNSSAFSLVRSSSHGDQKSAFCKPSKRTSPMQLSNPPTATAPSRHIDDMQAVLGYNNLMASNILSAELQQQQSVTVSSQVALNNHYHYAPQHWSRNIGVQLQTAPTPSLAILPPTFNSFGVSVQNWCAKCNLSFRMTSDLVFHMRSHHKKEFAAESQVRKRREEKLTCPICHEYFRERHHLSRHMTSHN